MRFLDLTVDRFGVLQNSELCDLSEGLTVVYGGNGSGKTTLVKFLEGLLFGYTTEHQAFQPDDQSFGGAVSLEAGGRSLRIARERRFGVSTELSTVDLATGITVSANGTSLPSWVNETVFGEIFSVGCQEASRFDLLSRLCLDGKSAAVSDDEIRRAELAIEQSVQEREGNGLSGGLRKEKTDLLRLREDLGLQLDQMRRVDPGIPARISTIEAELRSLQESVRLSEQQILDLEGRIRKLEQRLAELRRQNIVSLDRQQLESQIGHLQERQQRWDDIRKAINREIGALQTTGEGSGNRDSLTSIRTLVSRLEERMESLQSGQAQSAPDEFGRAVFADHIRSEVFSLCDYVAQHESSVDAYEASLEKLLGQRTLQDAENVNTVLQGQIDALREELNRSEDIISTDRRQMRDCPSSGHSEYRRTSNGRLVSGSIEEVEHELDRLRSQLENLRAERTSSLTRIRELQNDLSVLQNQLNSAASLEELDRVKAEIASCDARLERLNDRWEVLKRTESNLHEVIQRLSQQKDSPVLDVATQYITRLTDGNCYRLESDSNGTHILACTKQSTHPQTLQQLSRGTRDQVALALRLALIQCRANEDTRCPLILDDVFITADDERAEAVADLLMEVAEDGQQILFLTCQNDVRDLFVRRNVTIKLLEQREAVPTPQPVFTPVPLTLQEAPKPVPEPLVAENTNWLFYLEVDNSIEDLSGLTVAEIEAIRATGLETIDDLLSRSVDELESLFRDRGYSINRDRIRALRGQSELSTQIPMLRRSDAELLYAAGIESTVELSRMRPETVYDRVSSFQTSQAGSRFRRSGRTVDRQQAINWSRWSQHARTISDARRSRSRFFVKASDQQNSPHSNAGLSRSQSGTGERRIRGARSTTGSRRQRRPSLTPDARRQTAQRQSRRRQRLARHSSSYRTESAPSDQSQTTLDLKFYLNRSDDVEAAPSIGPKTAQRLGTVGVYTVDDLLTADASDTAARLDNRRISMETIQQWQSQARLVCQVPELRGHDSQILVACGVTEAEQLAGKRPADLYAIVGPFADTSEGERIVRGGRKPDLEEITDWIRFAQQARSLKSAA